MTERNSVNKHFYFDRPRTRYTFEPIEGCAFGCPYCNAFTCSKDINNWDEWVNPKIIQVDTEDTIKEFESLDKKPPIMLDFIFVCSTSDPFQSKDSEKVVYKSLSILNNILKLNSRLLTKGVIPNWVKEFPNNAIGVTIDTIKRLDETRSSGNIDTLRKVTASGVYTIVSLQPFDLSVTGERLHKVLEELKFIRQINFGILDDAPKKDFSKAFYLSDIVADFCIKHRINFFNGSPRFNKASKKRLVEVFGVTEQIWYGDNIEERSNSNGIIWAKNR